MKKTNVILVVLVVVLAGIGITVYLTRNSDSKKVYRDFAVQDTASIDKIFLADKSNKTVLLERKDNYWTVNEKYKARRDFVNILLETLCKVEVKSPVPESKLKKVLSDLSVSGIKAEIYQKGELVKTYYVGGVTDDNTGTYMIMEGSDVPFIMHIPGFNGFLTIRYIPEVNEWRERQVFNYNVKDIAKVTVEYPSMPEASFVAVSNGDNTFSLTNVDGSAVDFEYDGLLVKEYMSRCKFLGFEAYIMDELQESKRDSLLKQPVVAKISVLDTKGKTQALKTYYRQNINQAMDDDGKLYEYDIDRLYGIINDKEVVLLQYYIIDPLTVKKSDFAVKN